VILFGMLLFFGDELSLDGYLGNGVALGSGFCFAWLTLFLRRHREESAISALVLGNLLAGVIGLPFMFQSAPDVRGWMDYYCSVLYNWVYPISCMRWHCAMSGRWKGFCCR